MNRFNDTIIQVSVDGYLHCFDIMEDAEAKKKYDRPTVKFRIHKPVLKKFPSGAVEIKNKENLLAKVFEASGKMVLKFNSSEEIEEFERLIKNF